MTGFLERPRAARIVVSGADARDFLHRMVTAHVASLEPGQGTPSFLLERSGRIVDRVLVLDRGDDFLLAGNDGREEAAAAWIEKYVIADDVRVTRGAGALATFTLVGQGARAALAGLGDGTAGLQADLGPWAGATVNGPDGPRTLVRAEDLDGPSWHLVVPAADREAVRSALTDVPELDDAAYATLRLRHGVPRFDVEYGEKTIPLETGMRQEISFTKGCYLGQEVIARLDHQKRVKRALVHLRLDAATPPAAGAPVLAGEEKVGELTDAVAEGDHAIGFAYVSRAVVRFDEGGRVVGTEPLRVIQDHAYIHAEIAGGRP